MQNSRPQCRTTPELQAARLSGPSAPLPVFELHIRPLFRSLDREHMDWWQNLWHFPDEPGSDPIAIYTQILNRLKEVNPDAVMPPPYAGGPWPPEWIDLFERWLAAGAPRLGRALVDSTHLAAVRNPGTSLVHLTVEVTLPSPGHVAWLERRFADEYQFSPERADEFVVYERAMTSVPSSPTTSTIEDDLELPTGIATVKFIGSNGTFTVAVT